MTDAEFEIDSFLKELHENYLHDEEPAAPVAVEAAAEVDLTSVPVASFDFDEDCMEIVEETEPAAVEIPVPAPAPVEETIAEAEPIPVAEPAPIAETEEAETPEPDIMSSILSEVRQAEVEYEAPAAVDFPVAAPSDDQISIQVSFENEDPVSGAGDLPADTGDTDASELPDDDEEEAEKPAKPKRERKTTFTTKSGKELPIYISIVHDVAMVLAVLALIFVFLFRFVCVKGDSMAPTLENNNVVLMLSEFISSNYQPGDVVVMVSGSYNESKPLVKRVVAVEGQIIDIDFNTGLISINGTPIEETYIDEPTVYNAGGFTYPLTVPEGSVFVMGDNRNHSMDSRDERIGFVKSDDILGKVVLQLSPLSKIGVIK